MQRFVYPLLLLCAAASFLTAGTVPTTYTAVTDMTVRQKPALPAMGPAGTIIKDPTFGSRILRVTDGNTQANAINTVFLTPAGGFVHNWNADSTMFWVFGNGGIIPFKFDASKMTASRIPHPSDPSGGLILPFSGPFSYRRPNILYGGIGIQIVEYDFNTLSSKVVFDAAKAMTNAPGGAYSPSVSDDDSKLCLAFGDMQDQYPYVAVLDRNTGRYSLLDTQRSVVNGKPAPIALGFGIHSAYLDRSGRFVIIGKGVGDHRKSDWVIWDTSNDDVYEILAHWSGHDASGFGVRVNESGYVGGTPQIYEQNEYSIRSLDAKGINNPRLLVPIEKAPTPHLAIESGHFSWNNAQPNALAPIVGTHYRDISTASMPWRAWDDEVIGVATDGSGQVWRFAHHRSLYDGTNFWDSPRGNVSQDGRWFAFTSNWEKTLGSNAYGYGARQDVFICELSQGTAPAAPALSAAMPQSGNLLINPGFEQGGSAWQDADQPGRFVSNTAAHSGASAMTLATQGGDRDVSQQISVTPNATYSVSAWLTTGGMGKGGFSLVIDWLNGYQSGMYSDVVGVVSGNHTWTQIKGSFTAPSGAATMRIRLHGAAGSGNAAFDDVTVIPQ